MMCLLLAKKLVLVERFAIVVDSAKGLENLKVLEDLVLGLSLKLMEEVGVLLNREKREESRKRGCPYKLAMGGAW
jgi:hypothetical protein